MPTVVIYKNTYYEMVPVLYENQDLCFRAVQNYMKSLNIYDEDYQNDLENALCLRDLASIIDDYDIEEIHIHKVYEKDPKELN